MRPAVLLVPSVCTDANLRLVRQCGATDIVLTCPGFSLEALQESVSRIRGLGLKVDVIERFVPHDKIVHGLPGREEQVANIKQLIRNMGECGIKVLCYNWMPSDDWTRTRTEVPDRGGALCTAFDVQEKGKLLAGQTIQADAVVTPAAKLWETLRDFLREVLPVAEEAGVQLALHPDDPPLAVLHGKPQIIYDVDEIERVTKLVDSPANGVCFCQGTFASAGIDVPSAIRRLGKTIKFVHSRNVAHEPVEGLPAGSKFRETWQDNGDIDMVAAYQAYYDVLGRDSGVVVRPDHVPTLEGESNEVRGRRAHGRAARRHREGLPHVPTRDCTPRTAGARLPRARPPLRARLPARPHGGGAEAAARRARG